MDNRYVCAAIFRQRGAVLVLNARLPTVPQNYDGQPRIGGGQLRYWSLCAESQATPYYACLTDDQCR